MTTIEASAPEADRLVRAAHEQAYRYPEGFGGFSADLVFEDGNVAGRGTVTLRPGETPELSWESGEPSPDESWLRHELGMIAGHRWHRPYEEADGRWEKQVDATSHPLGALITIADGMDSSYRILDGEITAITRTHGGKTFTVLIQDRIEAPGGRSLSSAFTVSYWDASGRLSRSEAYTDKFAAVGDVLLPRERRIVTSDDDGISVRRLELSKHTLLAGAAS